MWENLAIQIPIVAAFIWFVLEMDKRAAIYAAKRDEQWRAFLAAQSAQSAEALNKAAGAIERVAQKMDEHDSMVRQAIAKMEVAAMLRKDNAKPAKVNPNL